jgi:hypothetical protein
MILSHLESRPNHLQSNKLYGRHAKMRLSGATLKMFDVLIETDS